MRPAEPSEVERWDELVAARASATSVLQSRAFAEIKRQDGWRSQFYLAGSVPLLLLQRSVPGYGRLWYAPGGPMVNNLEELTEILPDLMKLSGFLVQMEPELAVDRETLNRYASDHHLGMRPGIQPNQSTVVVDLRPDEEAILAGFGQKTRYNVRLAERKGVSVEAVKLTTETMDQMHRLMRSSQDRGDYFLRSPSYFERAWRRYVDNGCGQLFLAIYDSQILAGVFAVYLGEKGLYKDGGSTREHRDVQAMSLLQWEVMRWLKGQGVTSYDLHGVPPVERLDDPTHPFSGLARFKIGFNSQITSRVGLLELPLQARRYRLWRRIGERLYGAAYYRVRHRPLY